MRVILLRDSAHGGIIRRVGMRAPVSGDAELASTLLQMKKVFEQAGKMRPPVLIDAAGDVPWQEVVRVIDLCRISITRNVEFTAPYP